MEAVASGSGVREWLGGISEKADCELLARGGHGGIDRLSRQRLQKDEHVVRRQGREVFLADGVDDGGEVITFGHAASVRQNVMAGDRFFDPNGERNGGQISSRSPRKAAHMRGRAR